MGGNIKKLKFLREAACSLLAFILCLRQTVHEKVISPVAPFMFGKNKSRKSNNERRYCGKGTKNRYLKRNSIF